MVGMGRRAARAVGQTHKVIHEICWSRGSDKFRTIQDHVFGIEGFARFWDF